MNFSRQMTEKRRWLVIGGVCCLLLAAFFLMSGNDVAALKSGIIAPQNLRAEEFSAVTLFFLLAAATLVSEDLTCISAGVLASQGKMSLALAVAACGFGIFIGDLMLFAAGRILGRKALKMNFIKRFISEDAFEKSSAWLVRRGMKTVFISRFIFGLRLPLYFAAGALKTSAWRFTLYFSIAVALWTPILVGASSALGGEIVKSALFEQNLWLALILIIIGIFLLARTAQKLATWKGRRIYWGKIKRRFIWEFWSIRVFYAPVVVYVLFLAIKHRSLTVFTCANPSILASGFVGESKAEILRGLAKSTAAEGYLLKHLFISKALPLADKIEKASDFMAKNDLNFPIALKPDIGERGLGVALLKSAAELAEKLNRQEDLILQEYAAGEETSVFYYRYPRDKKGKIFAVTEKRFPSVSGDGISTLEELILRDRRAVCLAEKYLERNRERLESVPARGENVQIIDIGTHSRGAIFLNGERLKTAALEKKIDEICRGFEGFFFGRFDIRTASLADFAAGKNFKIIELNGVTSEATNIYDPKFTIFDAYEILFRQWRIAFEIGAQNRKLGTESTKIVDLAKLILGIRIENSQTQIQN